MRMCEELSTFPLSKNSIFITKGIPRQVHAKAFSAQSVSDVWLKEGKWREGEWEGR